MNHDVLMFDDGAWDGRLRSYVILMSMFNKLIGFLNHLLPLPGFGIMVPCQKRGQMLGTILQRKVKVHS